MRSLFYAMVVLLVAGCSSNVVMSGRQVSNVDPEASITTQSRIRVQAVTVEDSLTNKRYLPQVVQAFKANGFYHVGANLTSPDVVARFNLTSQVIEREEKEPIYKDVRTGRTTRCFKNKDGGHYCDTDYHVMPHLVGYETVTRSLIEAKLHLELVNPAQQVVLQSTSTVENNDCSRWKLYEFLIAQSIKQLDVNAPVDQPFRIEMPEDYECTDRVN